jgi:hypothetical protein
VDRPSTELATTMQVAAIQKAPASQEPDSELACLATAAALGLLADAVQRGGAAHDQVVEALKAAGVHERFADVLTAAATVVMDEADDPYDFDSRLRSENLSAAASQIRDAFHWL